MYLIRTNRIQEDHRLQILRAEEAFEAQLVLSAEALLSVEQLQIVTVTGPSCSGKTTTSEKLRCMFENAGHPVYMVSIDNFFRDRTSLPKTESGRIDYDTAASLDLDCLTRCLDLLVREEETDIPVFDFRTGTRSGYTRYIPRENDIILLEGIQAMYPEIRSHLPHAVTRNVAIGPQEDVCAVGVGGSAVRFTAREIRLLRRLVRDARTRSSDAENTLAMWQDVCLNEDANITPYLCCADIVIDSFLPYELSVIRRPAERLLRAIPADSPYHTAACSLLERLAVIIPMPADEIPDTSVFREFIGNDCRTE
ncbi:MAG: uridine kinase [Eubacteriales bacterium]